MPNAPSSPKIGTLPRRAALRLAGTAVAAGLAGCTTYPGYSYYGYGPDMVWLPSANVYVGLGYSYPFFYWNNAYYYRRYGYWYRSPYWRGPWHRVPGPPYGYHSGNWNRYQSRARYHAHHNPNWRQFRAK